jgi:hypothetical protein
VERVSASGTIARLESPPLRPAAGPPTATARQTRLGVLATLAAATSYVYLADPDTSSVYPPCPSRTLLGVDCPLCGGLRGTNALLHGRISEALDHNVLLPVVLAVIAVGVGLWMLPLLGLPERRIRVPRWAMVTAMTVLVAFAVLRNLPIAGLEHLASDA